MEYSEQTQQSKSKPRCSLCQKRGNDKDRRNFVAYHLGLSFDTPAGKWIKMEEIYGVSDLLMRETRTSQFHQGNDWTGYHKEKIKNN